jgi:hypothetical protein
VHVAAALDQIGGLLGVQESPATRVCPIFGSVALSVVTVRSLS